MLNRRLTLLLFLLVVLFAAPAQAQFHIYWGDMHGHTVISDGKGNLDDYFTHARDNAKLDFVVVSDHDFGNAAPWKMPHETWTLTQDKADQLRRSDRQAFAALPGCSDPPMLVLRPSHLLTPANSCLLTTFHTVSWMTSASLGSVTLYGSEERPCGSCR